MRLSDDMNFPHPVLADWRDDFDKGKFAVDITYREDKTTGRLELAVESELSCSAIESLIEHGDASFGCFVRCTSTGFRRLIELALPRSNYTFERGDLLDTVTLRPVVWTTVPISNWSPLGAHPEFEGFQKLRCGDIVAMAAEHAIEVGQADLPSLETIFSLKVSEDLENGEFNVDLDNEKITILAARDTYDLIETLRVSGDAASAAVMNSLYVPVVIRILSQISTPSGEANLAEFEGRRWVTPFRRRCSKLNIQHRNSEILANALKLMDRPFHDLEELVGGQQ